MQENLLGMFFLCEALHNKRNTVRLGITMLMVTKLSLSLQNSEPDDCLISGCDLLPFYLSLSTFAIFKRLF